MQLELMVVLDWSVCFFLAYVSEIRCPHPFVLLHLVVDVLPLCFPPGAGELSTGGSYCPAMSS